MIQICKKDTYPSSLAHYNSNYLRVTLEYYQQVCKIFKRLVANCESTVRFKNNMNKKRNYSGAGFCDRAKKQCRPLLAITDQC